MTKTVCIIQARLGSARLPAKVLLPLPTGRTVIEEVVYRAKQIEGVNQVVVAAPEYDLPIIERYVDVTCVPGPEADVLERYHLAALETAAKIVIRITADCPLLNPTLCSAMLRFFADKELDYLSNAWPIRVVPHGWDCEITTAYCIRCADLEATKPYDREHVTPYIQHMAKNGKARRGIWNTGMDRSHERLTLDTIEDYRHIYQVMQDELTAGHRAA
jgi:spore coat polysaccharide biosynthesis protein SpsF (cytidylyltransferase family)